MTRYDRRPRREWDEPRRSPSSQIGSLRLLGFLVILASSFMLLNRGSDEPAAPTTPRVAVDAAIASPVRGVIGTATITASPSAELARRLRDGLFVDLALLDGETAQSLVDAGTCSDAAVFASRGRTQYVACNVNAQGSSRERAATVRDRLASLDGRDALIGAGLDVPQTGDATPPAATAPGPSTP